MENNKLYTDAADVCYVPKVNIMLDRKVKRPEKEKKLIEKLGEDKYHWAFNVQHNNFPSWTEAFEYAYKLGLERGRQERSFKGYIRRGLQVCSHIRGILRLSLVQRYYLLQCFNFLR